MFAASSSKSYQVPLYRKLSLQFIIAPRDLTTVFRSLVPPPQALSELESKLAKSEEKAASLASQLEESQFQLKETEDALDAAKAAVLQAKGRSISRASVSSNAGGGVGLALLLLGHAFLLSGLALHG